MAAAQSRRVSPEIKKRRAAVSKHRRLRGRIRAAVDDVMDLQIERIQKRFATTTEKLRKEYLRCAHNELDVQNTGAIGHAAGSRKPTLDFYDHNEDNR